MAAPVEDYLDEDEVIAGQKYALVSFLSPENVLDKKELFFFERFLHSYEVDSKVKGLEAFLAERVNTINRDLDDKANALDKDGKGDVADLCRKNRIPIDTVMEEYQSFVRKQQKDINKTKIQTAWDDFLFKEQAKLEEEFHAKNNFRTSIRGFKVRAVARDEKEAEMRAKKLQKGDKYHNIYCSEIGKWTPWDPKPHLIADQEYAQEELNALMKKYRENEDHKSAFFEEQKKSGVKPAEKKLFGPATETASTPVASISRVEEEVNTVVADDNKNTIFGAVGDLVLERKMKEKEKAESEEKPKSEEKAESEEKPKTE